MNLNYSAEVCGNLTLDIHNETQVVMVTATVLMLLTTLNPRRRPRSMSPQFKLTTACSRICLLLYLSFLLVSSRSFTYYLLGAIEMTKLPITSHCKRRERESDHCLDSLQYSPVLQDTAHIPPKKTVCFPNIEDFISRLIVPLIHQQVRSLTRMGESH